MLRKVPVRKFKRGAEESAEKKCLKSCLLCYLYIGAEPRALYLALSSAPCFGPALSEAPFFFGPGLPRGPAGRESKKIILARTHEKKNIPPRTKFSFSLEIFILGLKFHSRLKITIPNPFFSAAREGPGMKSHSRLKVSFRIESLIFSIWPLEIDFFSILGPSGFGTSLDGRQAARIVKLAAQGVYSR